MGILSYTRRIKDIKERGFNVSMERVWKNGKATGTFVYWIPRKSSSKKQAHQAMEYEEPKSNWFATKVRRLI